MLDEARASARHTFLSVQYLRAVAALMVVVHHARNPRDGFYIPSTSAEYPAFAWGVDIFFVISGFIMGIAGSRERPREFITKRVIRVVPLYWLATLAFVVLSERAGVFSIDRTTAGGIIKSLLFIPHENVREPGTIAPYLIPGWTLNFEMFFYVLFFVGLLLARPLIMTATVLSLLVLAGLVFDPAGPIGSTYTSPLLLEFLIGHVLAAVYMRRSDIAASLWLLFPIGFVGLMSAPLLDGDVRMAARIVCAGAIVIGVAAFDRWVPYFRVGKLLGDASYSIYLTHGVVSIAIAYYIVQRVPVSGMLQFVALIACAITVSTAIGVVVYVWVEKPVLRYLRGRFLRRPEPASVST